MNATTTTGPADAGNENILFECPNCGKSLEIDARGAGYLVTCPDCQHQIQVPGWNELMEAADETAAIEETLRQLQEKIARIEQQQHADDHCFKRIGDEVVLIQAALDRITEIVETRSATS